MQLRNYVAKQATKLETVKDRKNDFLTIRDHLASYNLMFPLYTGGETAAATDDAYPTSTTSAEAAANKAASKRA